MNKAPHKEVVQKMREHPQLGGWEITDLGKKPFDLIANDKQIYFHHPPQRRQGGDRPGQREPGAVLSQQQGDPQRANLDGRKAKRNSPSKPRSGEPPQGIPRLIMYCIMYIVYYIITVN
jgi:hypothetical protein